MVEADSLFSRLSKICYNREKRKEKDMATYNFSEHSDKELEEVLNLYSKIAEKNLLCVPESFLVSIVEELNNRGIEVNYDDYFGD